MNRIIRIAWLCLAISVTNVQGVEAQGGIGPILDWINKLSGPQFGGVGAQIYFPLFGGPPLAPAGAPAALNIPVSHGPLRLRLTGSYRWSLDVTGSTINMVTGEAKLEYPFVFGKVELAPVAGIALHRFSGDVNSFGHYSFPLQGQLRFPVGSSVLVRTGLGFHLFPKFETTDFAPLTVDVSRTRAEWVFGVFLGLDFEIPRIRIF